jgi:hypothetical protein
LLHAPARAIGTSFRLVERDTEWLEQDQLLDLRHGRSRLPAEHGRHRRDRPPAAKPESLGHAGLLDRSTSGFVSEEDHCETAPGSGNQGPREWQEEACAVTGQTICPDSAAMPHPRQPFEQPFDDRARGAAARIGEEADSAGVAFAGEVIG